ncbi:MAG: c-type cytochrome [Polyangiaceae bacterium]|nr:c-type cytochrome [Polyangiaceae bacterium]
MNPPSSASTLLVLCLPLFGACAERAPESAVERGRRLFDSKELSSSRSNPYACSTCHDGAPTGSSQIKTGAPLAGATLRASFWGGQENDLLRSIDDCRFQFMLDRNPLQPSDSDAQALYAYLVSLEPGDPSAVAFDVVQTIDDLPRGDAMAGQDLFSRACAPCHGAMHTGEGRITELAPILPEDTVQAHADLSPRIQRLVFIEKIRHGLFLGYGGDMPPFSTEVMSDVQVSDVLEALGVLGE